jgi:hypothetical protein
MGSVSNSHTRYSVTQEGRLQLGSPGFATMGQHKGSGDGDRAPYGLAHRMLDLLDSRLTLLQKVDDLIELFSNDEQ